MCLNYAQRLQERLQSAHILMLWIETFGELLTSTYNQELSLVIIEHQLILPHPAAYDQHEDSGRASKNREE